MAPEIAPCITTVRFSLRKEKLQVCNNEITLKETGTYPQRGSHHHVSETFLANDCSHACPQGRRSRPHAPGAPPWALLCPWAPAEWGRRPARGRGKSSVLALVAAGVHGGTLRRVTPHGFTASGGAEHEEWGGWSSCKGQASTYCAFETQQGEACLHLNLHAG